MHTTYINGQVRAKWYIEEVNRAKRRLASDADPMVAKSGGIPVANEGGDRDGDDRQRAQTDY